MKTVLLLPALLFLSACGGAPEERVVILHTNDIHGQVRPIRGKGGLAALSALIKRIRREEEAKGARVVVVDCGDFYQGTPEGDLPMGRLVLEILNEIGYDALCLGDREFDRGQDRLRDLAGLAKFPFLGANIADERSGWTPDYIPRTVDIAGITFVGVITFEVPALTPAEARAGLRFEDPRKILKKYPDAIVLSHCGSDLERTFQARFVIGGHSHERISEGRYQQAGSKARYLGYIELGPEPRAKLIPVGEEKDPRVLEIIARYAPEIDAVLDDIVGELEQEMERHSQKLTSSPLGNLLCDIMRIETKADIAFHNRTGIRADLFKGPVRLRDLYQVSPIRYTIVTMELTGQDVKEILEFSVSEGSRFLLDVSGLEFEFDPHGPPRKRVGAIYVGNEPFFPNRRYRVATNSFLAGGGDKHVTFRLGKDRVNTFRDLLEAHRDYLKANRPLRYRHRNRILAR